MIADADNPTELEAESIIRRYITQELFSLPLNTRSKERFISLVDTGFREYFANKTFECQEMPLASLRAIKIDANQKVYQLEESRTESLSAALCAHPIIDAPNAASRKKFPFVPRLDRIADQTRGSFAEQTLALAACTSALDNHASVQSSFVKFPLIVGPPGAGKTHILMVASMYSLSLGLKTIITSVTAERSRTLGGEHIHLLFSFPVSNSGLESVEFTTEKCLMSLSKSPVKLAYLKRLEVLIIEEIGLVPVNILHVMDLVMRRINESSRPFEGLLLMATGDYKQLAPVCGRSIWISPSLYCIFNVLLLKHFVRSRSDADLQTVIALIRKSVLTQRDISEFISIVRRRCIPRSFVPSWLNIPDEYHRVLAKSQQLVTPWKSFFNKRNQLPDSCIPYTIAGTKLSY